jgi:hypothetical protein
MTHTFGDVHRSLADIDRTAPPAHSERRDPDGADEHEGATEEKVGDLAGPGAGYDNEPEQEKDTGGVAES